MPAEPGNFRVKLTGMSHDLLMEPDKAHEICLIDSDISSLQDLPLVGHIQTLNLHCNKISIIENLQHLKFLKHLDLSSNQIVVMQGLGALVSLRTLNLACNVIQQIKGLRNLRSLTKLNLSYNQVNDISGLMDLQGPSYCLKTLELQGNQLDNFSHVVTCLNGIQKLTHLSLSEPNGGNPVCNQPGYQTGLLNTLPQLQVLDGYDRTGKAVPKHDGLADIPGLEDYLEYLVSNQSNSSSQETPFQLITPKIDEALERFRSRALSTADGSSAEPADTSEIEAGVLRPTTRKKDTEIHVSMIKSNAQSTHEKRIENLEQQLAFMVEERTRSQAKSSTSYTGTSTPSEVKKQRKPSCPRGLGKQAESEASESESGHKTQAKKKPARTATTGKQPREALSGKQPTQRQRKAGKQTEPSVASSRPVKKPKSQPSSSSPGSDSRPQNFPSRVVPTTAKQDLDKLALMQELDVERERRWKAEQAARRLAERIQELQTKLKDEHEVQDVAIEATTRLKHALMNEKEVKNKQEVALAELRDKVEELMRKLESSEKEEAEGRSALKAMEATATKAERERLQQQAHEAKRTQEYQMRAAATARELDLVRNQAKQHEGKVRQLQELLAIREQEHRESLQNRHSMESSEVKDTVSKAVASEKERHQHEQELYKQKIECLSKQYSDLENEFRMALQIEAERFNELQVAFEKLSQESSQMRQGLFTATEKERKASGLVTELTAMVKEQKGRITELSKSKHEVLSDYKARIQSLEVQVEEGRRRQVQFELLKQDRGKLQTQLTAQESVIEGLKAERKLWGHELAQQGASLAQDRGRLEAQINSCEAEVASLKKQSERDNDALKIKTKILDDQTETIRKLKDGLVERDEEIRAARNEALKMQQTLEKRLEEESANTQDLQDMVERLTERKEMLKNKVAELQTDLDESKRAYDNLDRRWKDKGEIISQLETQVRQVKQNFDDKESKLLAARDKAIASERVALEKINAMDDAFSNQLAMVQRKHEEQLEQLKAEKQQQINEAKAKVLSVEEEMRQLLLETANQKKVMEGKLHRLTQAFSDIQQDMTS
ncbi:leucine-rich repeat and coiled-coil domain-containing protein 1-like isoform X2 [Anneissia japonica]|uniref:leucine-rich repeat and coiled-coil domain-containing protein 1-like isoform X2 n=1 Tax=Anneissia japonica TaxID=1529436 RepID=UPI00142571F6|nr:leucine-rich repeat and coiled-coil domain-containing protein 1-like isoform X2 [Anneissia japonica]